MPSRTGRGLGPIFVVLALVPWTGHLPAAPAGVRAASCGALSRSPVPDPDPTTSGDQLFGATTADLGDAWAVGMFWDDSTDQNLTLAHHWTGQSWKLVDTPNPPGNDGNRLTNVSELGSGHAWAVGYTSPLNSLPPYYTLAEYWDGATWSIVPSENPSNVGINFLEDAVALAEDDGWAVGWYDTGNGSLPLVERWDGAAWTVSSAPDVGVYHQVYGVDAVASNDVWAVGTVGSPPEADRTLILHWDGTSWTRVTSPNVGDGHNILQAVEAVATDDVWAVGYYDVGSDAFTLVEHWDGVAWTVVPSPDPFQTGNELFGVAAIASGDVWASGITGPDPSALLLHWDGEAWATVPLPRTFRGSRFDDLAASPGGELWAVGTTGLLTPTPRAYITHLCSVVVQDGGFVPEAAPGAQGGAVSWTFDEANTQDHQIVDASLGLFDSGLHGAGTSFVFTFGSAGTFVVEDVVNSHQSRVQVPTLANPKTGGTQTTFTVTWSAVSPAPGLVFDVQIRRPGSTMFEDWLTNQTLRSSPFVPDAGPGTYSFRARLRDTLGGGASGYSPPASVIVH